MKVDFKISRIIDDGEVKRVLVRIYGGGMVTEAVSERNPTQVSRYKRTARLSEQEFTYPSNTTFSQVNTSLKQELKKFSPDEPIDEQK